MKSRKPFLAIMPREPLGRIYLLSFIKFPKWAIKKISSQMANCLWNDNEDKHTWYLANWESIIMCKEYGGVGIPNVRDLNIHLLGSWLKRCQIVKENSGSK
jgi:hypothetical protein